MKIEEYRNIRRLRKVWDRIYRDSEIITNPFQSFTPNRIYYDVFHLSHRRMLLQPRFIYAQDEGSEVIFPIIVDRRKKRITEFAPLDYYDVLCLGPTDLIPSVLGWIRCRYPGYELVFSRVNESAVLASFADTAHATAERCVRIPLDRESYGDYCQSLAKHQRQNLRTAYNRLEKEGVSLSLEEISARDLPRNLKRECEALYEARKATKYTPRPIIKRIYARITKPVFRIMTEIGSGSFFILRLNGTPAAVMAGAYTKAKDCFSVPVLFSNPAMLRYSPGILLVDSAVRELIEKGVGNLDLARGEEPYKYAMGGIAHLNYTLNFKDREW